jgi:alpha-L-rhamnosidase
LFYKKIDQKLKMKHHIILLAICCLLIVRKGHSQTIDSLRASTSWNAQWIGLNNPLDPGTGYGVYYFRKNINIAGIPARFIIHISADNHYKLYVNGKMVSDGPARGDLYNWNYETVDIAKLLWFGMRLSTAPNTR